MIKEYCLLKCPLTASENGDLYMYMSDHGVSVQMVFMGETLQFCGAAFRDIPCAVFKYRTP